MSILAIFLVSVGIADLVRMRAGSVSRSARLIAVTVGLVVLLLLGLMAGFEQDEQWVLLVVAGLVLVAWVLPEGRSPWFSLGLPAAGLLVLLLTSNMGGTLGDSVLANWLDEQHIPLPDNPTRALLAIGILLVQVATGNRLVRLVLTAVGAIKPQGQPQPSDRLRGGRLLGPMERILIVGLGLAGQLTAAGIVIAAKGLLRWPELQAKAATSSDPGIDEITEYFLVGSFVSWLVALASLWLAA